MPPDASFLLFLYNTTRGLIYKAKIREILRFSLHKNRRQPYLLSLPIFRAAFRNCSLVEWGAYRFKHSKKRPGPIGPGRFLLCLNL